jgi:hypothetical protein
VFAPSPNLAELETVNLTPAWRFVIDCLAEYGALLQRTAPSEKPWPGETEEAAGDNPTLIEPDICILPGLSHGNSYDSDQNSIPSM